jgi:hypothetical protein
MTEVPDPRNQFDFKATIAANLLLQIILVFLFCYVLESKALPIITLIAIGMYWTLVVLAWPRRHDLRLAERLALRVGLGALLPLAALLVFLWQQCG